MREIPQAQKPCPLHPKFRMVQLRGSVYCVECVKVDCPNRIGWRLKVHGKDAKREKEDEA